MCRAGARVRGLLVMSPVTDLRHGERFGTSTPKSVSKNRRVEVWSKVSEHR